MVSQMYASVFRFLRESMQWYRAKRLKRLAKSFDQNFYDKFSDMLDEINMRADQIHVRGNIGHHAKTTDILYTTKQVNEKLDRIMATQEEGRRSHRESQICRASFCISALPSPETTYAEFTSESCCL
jgi:pterin-4a-carbinolamine dehydratase